MSVRSARSPSYKIESTDEDRLARARLATDGIVAGPSSSVRSVTKARLRMRSDSSMHGHCARTGVLENKIVFTTARASLRAVWRLSSHS